MIAISTMGLLLALAPSPEATPPTPAKTKPKSGKKSASKGSTGKSRPPEVAAVERDSNVRLDATSHDRWHRPGSRQRFALELKLGPYLPDVDRKYNGPGLGPYANIFGKTDNTGAAVDLPKPSVMPVLGFEWQFAYLAGTLGLGAQVGVFTDKANALLAAPEGGESLRSSADNVRFSTIASAVQFVYRFSLLADRAHIPLVPYVKGGPAYAFWWSKGGDGEVSRNSSGDRAVGGVWGWQVNGGMMLRLDFIERDSAKRLDQTTGINHTYIFGEYQFSRLDNFGSDKAIALGDSTWFAGLAIEF